MYGIELPNRAAQSGGSSASKSRWRQGAHFLMSQSPHC